MKDITEINTELLFRDRNKYIVIGNVAFRLKNFWYYFYLGRRKGKK